MSIRKAADQVGMTRQPPLPSGHAYPATVVGYDTAQGLALVQLEGASTVKPAAIGNSGEFAAGAAAISVSTSSTVMGIELAGWAQGADITSYAVPINQALTIARQLKHQPGGPTGPAAGALIPAPDKAPYASELTPCNKHARFTRAP